MIPDRAILSYEQIRVTDANTAIQAYAQQFKCYGVPAEKLIR